MKSKYRVPGWTFKRSQEISIIVTTLMVITATIGLLIAPSFWAGLLLLIVAAAWIIILNFFRDPDREINWSPDQVLSPADGEIADIITISESDYFEEPRTRIGIFLSLADVHLQRAPLSGSVAFIHYQEGKNLRAFDPAASYENEQIIMGMNSTYGLVVVKQISGILARKCYNYCTEGEEIEAGQRYGLIKFGSRVEVYLPQNAELQCEVGDKVKGGLSILANIP